LKHIGKPLAEMPHDLAFRSRIFSVNNVGTAIEAFSGFRKAAMPAQDDRLSNLVMGRMLFDNQPGG
jgi:hypothetical protein